MFFITIYMKKGEADFSNCRDIKLIETLGKIFSWRIKINVLTFFENKFSFMSETSNINNK